MEKITFWLLVSAAVRCAFGGIAAVLFGAWLVNEIQSAGLSLKNTGECIVGAIATAVLASQSRIEWLRRHAVTVTWVIVIMGIFATTVVAIIHQTTASDLINNLYEGTDRTVLNNKSFVVSAASTATGSMIGGFLSPDVTTMGTIFTVEAIVWTVLSLKVVKLMLSYLK